MSLVLGLESLFADVSLDLPGLERFVPNPKGFSLPPVLLELGLPTRPLPTARKRRRQGPVFLEERDQEAERILERPAGRDRIDVFELIEDGLIGGQGFQESSGVPLG